VTAQLQLTPADRVYVCLVDGSGKRLIDGQVVDPGTSGTTYTARRFAVLFGHGPQALRVNGRTLSIPASSDPIGYEITPSGGHRLAQAQLPTCTQ
jgi:hypothetical protein